MLLASSPVHRDSNLVSADLEGVVDFVDLTVKTKECALTVLQMYKRANAGHIGASLSCLEMLVYLYFSRLGVEDKFILSKGHAAAGLYAVLAHSGRIDLESLSTFYLDGTNLAAHPPCNQHIKDIPFGTGSLGHGTSLASGIAFAGRFTGIVRKVYCVVSEGDLNEGSTWEALMFAAHHKLDNLTVMVDRNSLQGFGASSDVLDLGDVADRFRAFGFSVSEANDGNAFSDLHGAFTRLDEESGKPRCLIAHTKKGHGVSFMEDKLEWHYLPMNDEQYAQAISEVACSDA